MQQDDLSKREVPIQISQSDERPSKDGQDVFVPWISSQKEKSISSDTTTLTYNRYYHFFDKGELRALVLSAAAELGISVRSKESTNIEPVISQPYLEIVQDGWERSNWYIELRLTTA